MKAASKLLLPAFFLLNFAAAPAQQIQISKENKTIAITTNADASALADVAVVSIGFDIYGKDQDGTYAEATRVSNAIMAALSVAGVRKESIASSSQSLSPVDPSSEEDKIRYSQGMRFEFSQGWKVTVPADQSANVLHIAITNGANKSGSIDWQLKSDDALQAEAAANALTHAREIATGMAKGLGAKLGQLVYASNQTPPQGVFGFLGGRATLNTESASISSQKHNLKPLAITPDRITRSATVYAVFAIE